MIIVLGLATIVGLAISGLNAGFGSGSSTAAYQNEDYRVPPPDTNPPDLSRYPRRTSKPSSGSRTVTLYSQTTPVPVRCSSQPINVATASDAQLKSHFEGLMECLVRVWEPPITSAGFHHRAADGDHLRRGAHDEVRRRPE